MEKGPTWDVGSFFWFEIIRVTWAVKKGEKKCDRELEGLWRRNWRNLGEFGGLLRE